MFVIEIFACKNHGNKLPTTYLLPSSSTTYQVLLPASTTTLQRLRYCSCGYAVGAWSCSCTDHGIQDGGLGWKEDGFAYPHCCCCCSRTHALSVICTVLCNLGAFSSSSFSKYSLLLPPFNKPLCLMPVASILLPIIYKFLPLITACLICLAYYVSPQFLNLWKNVVEFMDGALGFRVSSRILFFWPSSSFTAGASSSTWESLCLSPIFTSVKKCCGVHVWCFRV